MLPILVLGAGQFRDDHDTGRAHPENKARLGAVERGIESAGLGEAVDRHLRPRPARREELLLVHTDSLLTRLATFIDDGGGDVDPDTHVSEGSWTTALAACGAGLSAIEALQQNTAAAAFVGVRPPGHHATADRAMGFCLINNVAVAAAVLAAQGERVLIVDWDVHHGNGTQDIFWNDPHVLYVSTHQWPCYPGTGRPNETGGPDAPGLNINIPLPPGATGDVARAALDEIVAPAVESFRPSWVLISAGFDAHRDDPLASLEWSSGDFADLATTVACYAPQAGRVVAFLEGGYHLDALAHSVGAAAASLAGMSYRPEAPTSGGPGRDVVTSLAALRRRE